MGLQQKLTGLIEPIDPSWRSASIADRRAFYARAGDVALDRLKTQLSRGVGANGRPMKARIRAVLPDGADGPVMEPHHDLSRVIRLSDYMATDRSLTLFWQAGTGHATHRRARKAGKKPKPFGTILKYHADGEVPHAPVRDVRLSKASIHQVKLAMRAWWEARAKAGRKAEVKAKAKARARAPKAKATPKPARPPAEVRASGIPYVRDETAKARKDRVVIVRVPALDEQLSRDPRDYIGPGGHGGSARPGSYADALRRFREARKTGRPLEMPRAYIDVRGNVSLGDGGHRFAAARDLGLRTIPLAVPRAEAARIEALVGVKAMQHAAEVYPRPVPPGVLAELLAPYVPPRPAPTPVPPPPARKLLGTLTDAAKAAARKLLGRLFGR